MRALLERCAEIFDFIVIDLPPATIVTDALAVSAMIDGLIVAVRQNYTERRNLNECMYQMKKIGSKFLGFVMTDAAVGEGSYKRYGKYGHSYGYGYGYGYDSTESRRSGKNDKAFLDAAAESAAASTGTKTE